MSKIILIFLLFSFNFIEAQQESKILYPEPYPGWSIITSKIKYPEIAMMAGVNNSYKVSFVIDTLSKLTTLVISATENNQAFDSLFINEISNALYSIEWEVGSINEKPISMAITLIMKFTTSTTSTHSTSRDEKEPLSKTNSVESKSNIKIDIINVTY
jgi:hypothetical protein